MKIIAAEKRTDELIRELLDVWEASVRATHHFLGENDIEQLKQEVRPALTAISDLMYVEGKQGIAGFMGVENGKIEMLFLHPAYRGHGIGKKFINYALDFFKASLVDVNEQNTQGLGFYQRMGFKVISRSPLDASGNPFPILHMAKQE